MPRRKVIWAVDPGINNYGVAYWDGKTIDGITVKTHIEDFTQRDRILKAEDEIIKQLDKKYVEGDPPWDNFHILLVEQPTFMSRGTGKTLWMQGFSLGLVIKGIYDIFGRGRAPEIIWVPPTVVRKAVLGEGKGRMGKKDVMRKVKDFFSQFNKKAYKQLIGRKFTSHVWDALALIAWYLKKQKEEKEKENAGKTS